jgi:hypothetical protein
MKRWFLAAVLAALSPLALASYASAAAGIGVSKSCPTSSQVAGVPFNCSFTVANQDTVNPVTGLSVTNTVPCPNPPACTGGSTGAVPCLVDGVAVTTLAPSGNPGSSCSGTLQETAHDCSVGSLDDFVRASGTDSGQLIGGGAAQSVEIVGCTTTLTPTPTSTPKQTPIAAGISVSKSCPTSSQVAGVPFNCSFTVANQDTANPVTGFSVTNTVPCPNPPTCTGGSTSAVPCLVSGVPVTTLAPSGNPGSICSGTLQETAPDCSVGSLGDFIRASGTDSGQSIGGGAVQSVAIVACSGTPTITPTSTPRQTAIGTSTNTPTATPTGTPGSTTPTVTPTPSSRRRQPIVLPWRLVT